MHSDRRPGDARFGRHRDVPERAVSHSSNRVFRVRTVAGVVDCHKSRERFSMRLLVVLSVRCLKNRRLGVRLHFDPDVLEHDVLDDGRASSAHVEGGCLAAEDVAVSIADVPEAGRPCLDSRFDGLSPPAPKHTALHRDVLDGSVAERRNSLHGDRVVERPDEAVADRHPTRIADVDSIRVVAPLPDDLHMPRFDVFAVEEGKRPAWRVHQDRTVDADAAGMVEPDTGGLKRGVASFEDALAHASVDDTMAENVHVFDAFADEASEHDGVPVDIHPVMAFQPHKTGDMHSRPVAVGRALPLREVARRLHEQVQRPVRPVDFQNIVARPRNGKRHGAMGDLRRDAGRQGADDRPRERPFRLDFDGERPGGLARDVGRPFRLVEWALPPRPRPIERDAGLAARPRLHRPSVQTDGEIVVERPECLQVGIEAKCRSGRPDGPGDADVAPAHRASSSNVAS